MKPRARASILVRATRLACAALTAAVAGCGAADSRPAEWGFISPAVTQPTCATASCHGPAAAVSGLDFSTADSGYTSLTSLWVWIALPPDASAGPAGVPCDDVGGTLVCERRLRPLVTPYDAAGSRLVNLLRARGAPRMPPDRPLPEADIQLIERWIENGACRAGPSCAAAAGGIDAGGSGG